MVASHLARIYTKNCKNLHVKEPAELYVTICSLRLVIGHSMRFKFAKRFTVANAHIWVIFVQKRSSLKSIRNTFNFTKSSFPVLKKRVNVRQLVDVLPVGPPINDVCRKGPRGSKIDQNLVLDVSNECVILLICLGIRATDEGVWYSSPNYFQPCRRRCRHLGCGRRKSCNDDGRRQPEWNDRRPERNDNNWPSQHTYGSHHYCLHQDFRPSRSHWTYHKGKKRPLLPASGI